MGTVYLMKNYIMLHEDGIGNLRKYTGYILSILPSAIIVFSGMNKLMGAAWVVESLSKIGLQEYTAIIGGLEILCVILYWIPKTSNIGFFLLCSYVGGIIAAELAMGFGVGFGVGVAIMLYVGTMLRKPSLSGLGI